MINKVVNINDNNKNTVNNTEILKAQIWFADLGEGKGSQQGGVRPILIFCNRKCTSFSTIYQAITLTSQDKKWIPTHVKIEANEVNGLTKDSIALCETLTSIRKDQLLYMVGKVNLKVMKQVERAVNIQLDTNQIDNDMVERHVNNIEELYRFSLRIKNEEAKSLMIQQVKNQIDLFETYLNNYNKTVDMYLNIKYNNGNEIKIARVA